MRTTNYEPPIPPPQLENAQEARGNGWTTPRIKEVPMNGHYRALYRQALEEEPVAPDHRLEEARAVRIEDEVARRGIRLQGRGVERFGPCPACGGTDRFSINIKKQVWNCRGCQHGGDVIALVRHLDGVGFEDAVEKLSGRPAAKRLDTKPARTKRNVVARFDYYDAHGAVVYQVERVEYQNPDGSYVLGKDGKRKKDFPQRRPDPDRPEEWLWKVAGHVQPVLYRLPELIEAVGNENIVLVVEGERKVDLLRGWGIAATCNSGGRGSVKDWAGHVWIFKPGDNVVILPDNDNAGHDHANAVAGYLKQVQVYARILDLPGLGPKGDVIDWADAGGTAEQLHALIESDARPWVLSNGHDEAPVMCSGAVEGADVASFRVAVLFLRVLSYDGMVNMATGEWIVDGVIPARSKSVLFGQSDSFKSFIAVDLGCSAATGESFHGRATKQCKVIYIANEGANAVGRKRIPAWMAYHNIPKVDRRDIFLVPAETVLPNAKSRGNLLAAIRTIVSQGESFFLIIDVLRGTMNGSENDDEAAAAWTAAAEILVGEGASILAITHSPYSEDGRMRGHSHLWGSFDTRLKAEGNKEKLTTLLTVNRHKDRDSGGQWGFQLEEVEIEEHPGEKSLVPRLDGAVKPKNAGAGKTLPKNADLALSALRYALDEVGAIPPASNHIPANTKCVTIQQWREYSYMRSGADKPDTKLKAFVRGCEYITADGGGKLAAILGAYAWLV